MQSYARSVLPYKLNTCLDRNKVYFSHFVHNLYIKKLQNNFHNVGNFDNYTMFTWVSQKMWYDPWLKVIWSRSRSLTQYVHIFCQVLIFSIYFLHLYFTERLLWPYNERKAFNIPFTLKYSYTVYVYSYLSYFKEWLNKAKKNAISFWNVAIICYSFSAIPPLLHPECFNKESIV